MKNIFNIESHSTVDKKFDILGPIDLSIDYDDVDHKTVDMLAEKVQRILNDHWNDLKYSTEDTEFKNWFVDTFNSIAEEEGNSETVKDIIVEKNENSTNIKFTVNHGDYGIHSHAIKVTKDVVSMQLGEIIEGGDIEFRLRNEIKNKFHEPDAK